MSRHHQFLSASGPRICQSLLRLMILSAGVAFLSGCGAASTDKKPTFSVTGSVFSSGKPLAGAIVTLHPLEATGSKDSWPQGYPRAVVQPDGKFVASTYADSDGAPAGNYAVLLQLLAPCLEPRDDDPDADLDENEKPSPPLCDKFGGQYTQPTRSAWKVTVESKPVEIPRIDLQ